MTYIFNLFHPGISVDEDWMAAWNVLKDQVFQLTVTGALDLTYDNTRRVYIEMRTDFFYPHAMWDNYRIPPVTVSQGKKSFCFNFYIC